MLRKYNQINRNLATATNSTIIYEKVKITILKTMLNEDLAKEYGICGLKACPMMKVGDVFYADYAKPEGFCDEAWKAI